MDKKLQKGQMRKDPLQNPEFEVQSFKPRTSLQNVLQCTSSSDWIFVHTSYMGYCLSRFQDLQILSGIPSSCCITNPG
jgi:hypothetical protein